MGLKHQVVTDVTATRDDVTVTLERRIAALEQQVAALVGAKAKKSRAAYMREWRAKRRANRLEEWK